MKEFFGKFSLWAHGLAGSGIVVLGLIDGDGKFRDLVIKVFEAHPKIGTDIVIAAGIVTIFLNAKKKIKTVAE